MSTPIREDQEMYLKILYEAYQRDPKRPIRTSEVADAMSVTAASASEMLKRLGVKGFVDHVPYKGVTLNPQGVEAASRVKRREALLEVFLVKILDFKGDVKDVACRLEHALTDELEYAIDRMLGFPSHALDGAEFPPRNHSVEMKIENMLLPLKVLPDGSESVVELVAADGVDAKTLADFGISIGSTITRVGKGFLINGVEHILSENLQSRLLVRTQ